MSLKHYHSKRDFSKTKEPSGKLKSKNHVPIFVIQKHFARKLHFDFRLEISGTLKSWAVPKGISEDSKTKRLAVEVEDHPIEYASFEGTIPKGHYGGGEVIIWDKGTWRCEGDPLAAWKNGKIVCNLNGKKYKGKWALVRMADKENSKKNAWLLIKEKNDSVKNKPNIRWLPPQLPTLVNTIPNGPNWLHEIKFDGYRIQCLINAGDIKFFTREGHDWTERFISLKEDILKLNLDNALLDGEIVFLDSEGKHDFQQLQKSLNSNQSNDIHYYIFDILFLNNKNLTQLELVKRKMKLESLFKNMPLKRIHYSSHFEGNGDDFFNEICRKGLEGVVSKRKDAIYNAGHTFNWLKVKCTLRQEFVILGLMLDKNNQKGFKSLLLGYYDSHQKLHYAGRVGTGFTHTLRDDLYDLLSKEKSSHPDIDDLPKISFKNVCWIKPKFIAEIVFRGWTNSKILRHASFKGLRRDKPLKKVVQEISLVRITHPEKIVYPKIQLAKKDIISYYEKIADRMQDYIFNRPLNLVRCPSSIERCFFQKHLLNTQYVKSQKISGKGADYEGILIDNVDGLIELIQLNTLEIHAWNMRYSNILYPDQIIFDLDPDPTVAWKTVIESALFMRDVLKEMGLKAFVKTTGGKGLHIHLPILPKYHWEDVYHFARHFAKSCVLELPLQYTAMASKKSRKGKIFIDYLRNHWGATAVAPYSLRISATASIATPLNWDELNKLKSSDFYTINNIFKRLKSIKRDPWHDYWGSQQELPL